MNIYSETDSNISYFGWEIEEYPRQFDKEPEAITESFTPCVPFSWFLQEKSDKRKLLAFLVVIKTVEITQ